MTTIDKLGASLTVGDKDLIPIFKESNRRTRNVSVKDIAEYLASFASVLSVDGRIGDVTLDDLYTPIAHVGTGGEQHADVVSGGASGFMTGTQAAKLDGIETGAEKNTGQNVGSGAGVFLDKDASALRFKSLVAGAGVTLNPGANDITISALGFLNTPRVNIASAATVDLVTGAPNTANINITGTTTITQFTVDVDRLYFVSFASALTLTNNANIVTRTGANIAVQAGDSCVIRATAANVVEVLLYSTVAKYTQLAAIPTTSGTSHDVTNIPSWAKRITVSIVGVSTNGTSVPIFQIGTSGGIETTGYAGAAIINSSVANFTTGAAITNANGAANTYHGSLRIRNAGGNTWVFDGSVGRSDAAAAGTFGFSKTLSGTLDRLRFTTVGGTDSFDLGQISVSYE